jgi:cytochrome c oxidase cbb3-type subunit 4
MDIALFHTIWTLALLGLFIGIWAWAWSSKRKPGFDAAARLPLEDDVDTADQTLTSRHGEANHG